MVAGAFLWSTSGQDREAVFSGVPFADPGPVHVHGLGINPADGSLFIATHTGLFRVGKNSQRAARVTDRYQDTMGFSVVGRNRFIGSGHPDAREQSLPPLLGLIESADAGQTWQSVSLLGEADFHVLRSVGGRVYGYDASNDRLLASADEGESWTQLDTPGQIIDVTADPGDPRRLVVTAATNLDQGTYASRDGGKSWDRLNGMVGLTAWPQPEQLYLVGDQGKVLRSIDGGRTFAARGDIGGQPAALLAAGDLYVALHDGTIKRSMDGGATWVVRLRP
ncbi:MAG: exo-alpha-sialidase [Actinomycetota bacterium]|nr:exo-alpha-sialidase [Actinomycetota bacterium]